MITTGHADAEPIQQIVDTTGDGVTAQLLALDPRGGLQSLVLHWSTTGLRSHCQATSFWVLLPPEAVLQNG